MAGAGYKLFNTGDVLTAADVNTYLMQQTTMVFANAAARTTALSGVVAEGMISYLKDTKQVEVYNGTAWIASDDPNAIQNTIVDAKGDLITATGNDVPARLGVGSDGSTLVADSSQSTGLRWISPVGSLANPVINGGFDIWQRGTSIAAVASATAYQADRWQGYAVSSNITVSRQSVSDSTNLPNIQYAARCQRTASNANTGAFALANTFETANSIPFAGKTVTLSFYARRGADYSPTSNLLTVNLTTGTGTDQNVQVGFTGSTSPIAQNATLTTTWQRFAYTGTVATTATQMSILFTMNPTGTAGTNDWFEVTGVQIDVGTYTAATAPTFRRSGGILQGELGACQRYYWRWTTTGSNYGNVVGGFAETANQVNAVLRFPVTMRANPSTSLDIGGALQVYDSGFVTGGSWSANNPTTNTIVISYFKTASFTQYRPYVVLANNDATTYLGVTAEL